MTPPIVHGGRAAYIRWQRATQSRSILRVWLYLSVIGQQDHSCDRIGAAIGIGKTTVALAIRELVAAGYVAVSETKAGIRAQRPRKVVARIAEIDPLESFTAEGEGG